jgi:hypothetical protein
MSDPASTSSAASVVRSTECVCDAASGSPCTPYGDHLDGYVRAAKQGTIDRETLKQAVAGLTVIAPQAIVPSPSSADREGKQPADKVVRGHLQLVPSAERDIEAGE